MAVYRDRVFHDTKSLYEAMQNESDCGKCYLDRESLYPTFKVSCGYGVPPRLIFIETNFPEGEIRIEKAILLSMIDGKILANSDISCSVIDLIVFMSHGLIKLFRYNSHDRNDMRLPEFISDAITEKFMFRGNLPVKTEYDVVVINGHRYRAGLANFGTNGESDTIIHEVNGELNIDYVPKSYKTPFYYSFEKMNVDYIHQVNGVDKILRIHSILRYKKRNAPNVVEIHPEDLRRIKKLRIEDNVTVGKMVVDHCVYVTCGILLTFEFIKSDEKRKFTKVDNGLRMNVGLSKELSERCKCI